MYFFICSKLSQICPIKTVKLIKTIQPTRCLNLSTLPLTAVTQLSFTFPCFNLRFYYFFPQIFYFPNSWRNNYKEYRVVNNLSCLHFALALGCVASMTQQDCKSGRKNNKPASNIELCACTVVNHSQYNKPTLNTNPVQCVPNKWETRTSGGEKTCSRVTISRSRIFTKWK